MDMAQRLHPATTAFSTPVEDIAAAAMEALSEGLVVFDDALDIRLSSRRALTLLGFGRTVGAAPSLATLLEASPRLDQRATHALLGACTAASLRAAEDPPMTELTFAGAPGLAFALRRTAPRAWVLRIAEAPATAADAALAPDALTHLPGRAMFVARVAALLNRPAQRRSPCAVLCIRLDGVRAVADTLGQGTADALLVSAAGRLRGALRDSDLPGRIAGEEFAVLQTDVAEPPDAEALGARIAALLSEPYLTGEDLLGLGARVGIALAPADGEEAERLLRRARLASRRARPHGRDAVRRFDPSMDAEARSRLALEAALRRAVAEETLALHYQPQLTLADTRLTGFEALLRWSDPLHGAVPPAVFVPLAERLGLMPRLGAWVLRSACQEAAGWSAPLTVAVNIAPVQFENGRLVAEVTRALRDAALDPHRLELEVTEGVLLHSDDGTLAQLRELRALGVRIAMDDFGTGYSSLTRLSSFPFDRLKIDRSFVRDLTEGGQSAAIIRAVAELGQRLGLATTAEGVETEAQREGVLGLGCTEAQGFLFGRPMPAADVPGTIARFAS